MELLAQFQQQLPLDDPHQYGPLSSEFSKPEKPYTSAHDLGDRVENPLYTTRPDPRSSDDTREQDIVPTENIVSKQSWVSREAIDELKKVPGTSLPDIEGEYYEDREKFRVIEGNHRVNAGLETGQLFMPARVEGNKR